jgi:hypothetical protein
MGPRPWAVARGTATLTPGPLAGRTKGTGMDVSSQDVSPVVADPPSTLPDQVRIDWRRLTGPTSAPAPFTPALLDGLPGPARRWLEHSIAPGTPLRRVAVFRQHGEIKVGRWQRYEADWMLAPPDGFIWAATTRLGPVFIRGFDRYTGGSGEMRWRLFGRLPFHSAQGPDVTRSALGRLLGELCFVPAAALSPLVSWEHLDDRRSTACIDAGGQVHRVTLTVADSGRLERVDLLRWGDPDGREFREHTFTAVMDGREAAYDGFTIPLGCRAGWWHCPDGCAKEEFIRFALDHAVYR